MAKGKTSGREKLLEAWTPPKEAGEPIGCVTTSYTFSTELFEEECLSRFLRMESDSFEDDIVYVIEREEKLAQIKCAAALIDQHHCRGMRSPRWDLLPVRVKNGVMHAKVSLLYWQEWVRIIIASANLSSDGYRTNQEIFGVLDFHKGSSLPRTLLEDTLTFLWSILSNARTAPKEKKGAVQRVDQFLSRVKADSRGFGTLSGSLDERESRLHMAFLTPDSRRDIIDQLQDSWPNSTRPQDAFVVSPFYDKAEGENLPATKLWDLLRQRGEAYVEFTVRGREEASKNTYTLSAPHNLIKAQPKNRDQARTMLMMYKDIQGKDQGCNGRKVQG